MHRPSMRPRPWLLACAVLGAASQLVIAQSAVTPPLPPRVPAPTLAPGDTIALGSTQLRYE